MAQASRSCFVASLHFLVFRVLQGCGSHHPHRFGRRFAMPRLTNNFLGTSESPSTGLSFDLSLSGQCELPNFNLIANTDAPSPLHPPAFGFACAVEIKMSSSDSFLSKL